MSSYLIYFNFLNYVSYMTAFDTLARLGTTDFFTNNYFYLWNVFWCIPSFICFILFIFTLLNTVQFTKLWFVLFSLIYLLFFAELSDYWYLNLVPYTVATNGEHLNLLLLNSINKYHPLLFYITPIMVFISCGF